MHGRQRALTVIALSRTAQSWAIAVIAFLGGVGGGVVFPILPVVGVSLGLSSVTIGFILAANRITRLGFNPVTGSLLDRLGARWPVAFGLLVEALGTLAFSIALHAAHPAAWFLLGRVVWGVGSSLLLVGALAAILATAEADNRASMTARVRTAVSLGLPAGLVIGGLIAGWVSNNAAFLAASGLALVGALGAAVVLPDRAPPRRPSVDGARGGDWRRLIAMPTLRIIWLANALLYFAVSGVLLATVALLVEQRHLNVFGFNTEGSAGLLMAVLMGARAGAALASGRYLDRSASRTRLLLPAMLFVAFGLVALGQARAPLSAALALLLVGSGSGGLTIPLLTLLGDVTPPELHGRALSVYQWSSDLGGALGPVIGLALGRAAGYGWTYGMAGLAVLGMALPLRWLGRRDAPT